MVGFEPLALSHQPMLVLVRLQTKKKDSLWFSFNYRTNVKVRVNNTFAGDPHIFIVVAVVNIPSKAMALAELGLVAFAVDIIKKDKPRALSKVRAAAHRHSNTTVQLLTHHVSIHHVPVVITHCSPRAIVEHLHPALTPIMPIHQLYFGEMNRHFESEVFVVQISG